MRTKIDCCAKDCPDRCAGCHAQCERYQTQRKELDETNANALKLKCQKWDYAIERSKFRNMVSRQKLKSQRRRRGYK